MRAARGGGRDASLQGADAEGPRAEEPRALGDGEIAARLREDERHPDRDQLLRRERPPCEIASRRVDGRGLVSDLLRRRGQRRRIRIGRLDRAAPQVLPEGIRLRRLPAGPPRGGELQGRRVLRAAHRRGRFPVLPARPPRRRAPAGAEDAGRTRRRGPQAERAAKAVRLGRARPARLGHERVALGAVHARAGRRMDRPARPAGVQLARRGAGGRALPRSLQLRAAGRRDLRLEQRARSVPLGQGRVHDRIDAVCRLDGGPIQVERRGQGRLREAARAAAVGRLRARARDLVGRREGRLHAAGGGPLHRMGDEQGAGAGAAAQRRVQRLQPHEHDRQRLLQATREAADPRRPERYEPGDEGDDLGDAAMARYRRQPRRRARGSLHRHADRRARRARRRGAVREGRDGARRTARASDASDASGASGASGATARPSDEGAATRRRDAAPRPRRPRPPVRAAASPPARPLRRRLRCSIMARRACRGSSSARRSR